MYTREALLDKQKTLSAEKRARVQRRLRGDVGGVLSIKRAPREGPLPLSFSQERMWFMDQLLPGDSGFNILLPMHIRGRLDLVALRRSLEEIMARHEILRTTYLAQDGHPFQVIVPAAPMLLPLIDLVEVPKAERDLEAQRLSIREAAYPFDIEHGPVLRATCLRLGEQEHILLLSFHHIALDGWSQSIFLHELGVLYEVFTQERPSPLPELPIQFADFAQWQRKTFDRERIDNELAYWKGKLAAPLPVLELITERLPSSDDLTTIFDARIFPRTLLEGLKTLSRQAGTTLFMTLLAAFKVFLYRHTGQTDLVVGAPISDRDHTETEGLIGLFLNTIVLRTDLAGDPTFMELLGRVRQTVLEGLEHKSLPFDRIVNELQLKRDPNRNPIYQTMFVVQDTNTASPELPGLDASWVINDLGMGGESPDLLGVSLRTVAEGLECTVEYRSDLLNRNIVEQFRVLLEGIVANPEQRLSELPLLSDEERRQLLATWNDTRKPYPDAQCFSQLFEAQVACTPDAIAAVCNDVYLTYQELNRRANSLTPVLRARRVGTDTIVALLAERGLDLLTAILAVFKSGGAYLPLDPRYPAARIRQVLEQSQSGLVLSADEFEPVLAEALQDVPAPARPRVLKFSDLWPQARMQDDLPARGTPHQLAYVIFTSGSTGVPKGAMVEQRGMVNHLYAKVGDLRMTPDDVLAQTASQCFDISVWQFLAPLVSGGRTHILPDEIAHDPARLLEQIACQQVTILETVPSLMRAMLDQAIEVGARFNLASLRWLIPTGEALPPELARQWLNAYPDVPLLNAFGPTECSDDVTHYPLVTPLAPDVIGTPIGHPIANLRVYVLDEKMQPVPTGVAGELYVGGDGVGRGYLYEPVKTATAFIPDPFSAKAGARLYKTGDLGYWRPDGNLGFLGRIDHQVKVRGFRIELGEIEAVLRQHPQVQAAVVVAREDIPGTKQLVAYIVPRPGEPPAPAELREFTARQLPDYMVPSVVMLLETLPLTSNGKIDRKALPAPDMSSLATTAEYAPPETPVEIRLAEIWSEVLHREQIGLFDSFFDLGGHSLLATQVISRVNLAFQMTLPLRSIFEEPTLAGLALRIDEALLEELEKADAA